ncbi:uncharacterized protein L201_005579 [Kwoniella dendrophila CBS 6074]|uniref:Uncharacterized protein n=1 Tax=Kwoniella dendrophila CBS 6074 TaxID=1295534 RepID=A0AAX4K1M4_9TREE
MAPPPRPPRRVSQDPTSPNHAPSHSLSSLAMFNRVSLPIQPVEEQATVSRTQSLRAQAKHPENGGLGRSSSLKNSNRPTMQPLSTSTTQSPPTPPPVSSTAAFPPFQLFPVDNTPGADLKRHQSLTQGYGSSTRVRDRLEKSPAVLTLEQREKRKEPDHPPISPIVPSVWSPGIPTQDDGWNRAASQQLQNAFDAMNLGRRMMNPLETDILRHPQSAHPADEPSWVTSLVGADPAPRNFDTYRHPTPRGFDQFVPPYLQQPMQPFHLGAPFNPAYPSPPNTAMQHQDRDVIELARQKGLNPATYNCRPQAARFFVIKSYTRLSANRNVPQPMASQPMPPMPPMQMQMPMQMPHSVPPVPPIPARFR